ncbi:SDR family oxidoreductase [Paenibacillus sp. N1-5-1-14]|uniref:NAD(P)-dependent oxidoreductase n=1 Tax=Paenibacillus radicibacter TaxID=2972488 RepID=UPI0021595B1A|nr:SDR family oxidoreductase [Paenibacillus radicibacter]MCR8644258.1 SDR family oxidoreductase [Paenibacillus radicibacter]
MKLVVFGATGGTGRQIVMQALEHGHQVTVIVRNPEAMDIRHEHLTITQGDVLKPATYENILIGHDAVLSALGVSHRNPTTVYSEGVSHIVRTMESAGVRRLICLSSAGLEIPNDTPFLQRLVIRSIIQPMYKHAYADMARMESLLLTSQVNWTVIRPPRLTNSIKTGKYRIAKNMPLIGISGISRADLADYMLKSIKDESALLSRIEISY